jgi:hypothetical protein
MRVLATDPSSFMQPNHTYLPRHLNSVLGPEAIQGHLASAKLSRRTQDTGSHPKSGYYKYQSLTSYQGHPYPPSDNSINQRGVNKSLYQMKVMSAYPRWCSTLVHYKPAIYSETSLGYDIMRNTCTPMDGMSGGTVSRYVPLTGSVPSPADETSCIDKKERCSLDTLPSSESEGTAGRIMMMISESDAGTRANSAKRIA